MGDLMGDVWPEIAVGKERMFVGEKVALGWRVKECAASNVKRVSVSCRTSRKVTSC